MANYTGKKCFSCGEVFKDGDDIVVCPECGTPYHRECYLKEGKCINDALHESCQSWEQTQESVESENIRCIRCGFENPPDKLFCEKCGTPLTKNDTEERPFNDMDTQNNAQQTGPDGQPYGPFGRQVVFDKDSDLEGIKLDDYAKFVKTNPLIFLSNFIRFGKFGGKISINFAAFLFPHLYFLFSCRRGCGSWTAIPPCGRCGSWPISGRRWSWTMTGGCRRGPCRPWRSCSTGRSC